MQVGLQQRSEAQQLAPIYLAKERGMGIKVFSDEIRPLL